LSTKLYADESWLREAYETKSIYDIAAECDAAPTTIRKYLKRFNIKTRSVSESMKLKYQDNEYSDKKHEQWDSEEYKEKHRTVAVQNVELKSKISKGLWSDNEFRKKQEDHRHTNESKQKISAAVKKKWEDTEYIEKHEKLFGQKSKMFTRVVTKMWQDLEYAKRMTDQSNRLWQDEEYKQKHLQGMVGAKEKISQAAKALWATKRDKMLAAIKSSQTAESQQKKSKSLRQFYIDNPDRILEISTESKHNWTIPEYRAKILKRYQSRFIDKANKKHQDAFDYGEVEYGIHETAATRKVLIKCDCGHRFRQLPSNHLVGSMCPRCLISQSQREIADFISVHTEYTLNDRSVIYPYELDILVSQYNFAIEFHGLRWHSYDVLESAREKSYLQYKYLLAESTKLQLLQFFDFQWELKQDIIKSILLNKLGLSQKYDARKLTIKPIDTAQEFFNQTHLKGYHPHTIALGLYDKQELIMAISFTKRKDQHEITHMSAKLGTIVRGGVSKLLKHAHKLVKTPIYTYADLMHSNGLGYQNAGMELASITKPGYFYYKGKIRLSRYQCQKHKLHKILQDFDPSLSESLNMFNNGFRRVWDAGHLKFTLN